MSEQLPQRADLRQLRTQAKERLRLLRTHEATKDARLVDAQRLLARELGHPSWPALVAAVETPRLIDELRTSIETGDAERLERLLKASRSARRWLDRPLFEFDSPALLRASRHPNAAALLPVLVRYGADPNVRSSWWAGGFGALDGANEGVVDVLLGLGTRFDVWSSAAHGRIDVLRELLDRDPASVNGRGGDGATPLHFAATPEIVELLIARGADLEMRDVDHEGTAVQHHVRNPEILRTLLRHGARPDLFTAVALDDAALAREILIRAPESLDARAGAPPFATVDSNGGHIYVYRLGDGKTPVQIAAEWDRRNVLETLVRHAPPVQRLLAAAWAGDRETVESIRRDDPEFTRRIETHSRAVADAAVAGRLETVRLLLESGFDPLGRGLDTGTALHTACWYGYLPIVRLLIDRVPLELRDDVHGSPPLGWATHGARWCGNPKGDYVGIVRALLEAGADVSAPANRDGATFLEQAGPREDVATVLRSYGALS